MVGLSNKINFQKGEAILVWIPLEADSETRAWVQMVYLGGDPREHQGAPVRVQRSWAEEEKEASETTLPLWLVCLDAKALSLFVSQSVCKCSHPPFFLSYSFLFMKMN